MLRPASAPQAKFPSAVALMALFATTPFPSLAQPVEAASADVASPEAIVHAMYETVNRRPGEGFDWDRLRTLFLPGAMLIPSRDQTAGALRALTVEGFIDWVDENTVVGGPNDPGFQEEEIQRRVERYGDVAQVFSTYQKRFWGDEGVLGRGINAIQLVHHDGRWWIVSVTWDEEAGAGMLPQEYLPGAPSGGAGA